MRRPIRICLALALLLTGCTSAAVPSATLETYGLEFCNCAGETTSIHVNGRERFIRFHPESDATALTMLRALKADIYEANADGSHLFITGRYAEEPAFAEPPCATCARQEYHYFKLSRWYLIVPFNGVRWIEDDDMPSGSRAVLKPRTSLGPEDFNEFENKENTDFGLYQKSVP